MGVRTAALQIVVVSAALLAAFVPRPPEVVERLFAGRAYPRWQAIATAATNRVPFALLDVLLVAAGAFLLWRWSRAVASVVGRRDVRPAWHALVTTTTLGAVTYLVFLAAWGLNYGRPPLIERLALSGTPPTAAEVGALLETAVEAVNLHHARVATHEPRPYAVEPDVAAALAAVDRQLGRPRATVPGVPKPTLLATYFRSAGVDGLTSPFGLEILLNPDLTPAERPFVLAHEWAHLSGHAAESDANFIAWLVTQAPEAAPETRYSGWLFLVSEAARHVPAPVRTRVLARLDAGPRADLAAIARRLAQRVDVVERVGWRVYDSYLKSQGVESGVSSYSEVVSLIVRARRTPGAMGNPAR